MKELQKVKVILGRFQPFTLGHLKLATYNKLNGPDKDQQDVLREQPNIDEIKDLKTVILVISTPVEKRDVKHPFDDGLMKREFDIIKKSYKDEIADIIYVKSADIVKWGPLLKEKGYQAAVWITGSDEFGYYKRLATKVEEYEERFSDSGLKGSCTLSFYAEEVKRDDSSDDFSETISATKVREALKNDDKEAFMKMMPKGIDDDLYYAFQETINNVHEPEKKSKKVKESKIYNYIISKNMRNLNDVIKEAAQTQYRVAFLDAKDKEDIPFTVTILVDKENVDAFEKFLEKEQDNIFYAAEGGNVCYP